MQGSGPDPDRAGTAAVGCDGSQSGLRGCVSHLPPGTRKWHTIEHRTCCHITANWRGNPLESLEVVVSLIGDTTTAAGLRIQAALDAGPSPKGLQGSDAEMKQLQIDSAHVHGESHYLWIGVKLVSIQQKGARPFDLTH